MGIFNRKVFKLAFVLFNVWARATPTLAYQTDLHAIRKMHRHKWKCEREEENMPWVNTARGERGRQLPISLLFGLYEWEFIVMATVGAAGILILPVPSGEISSRRATGAKEAVHINVYKRSALAEIRTSRRVQNCWRKILKSTPASFKCILRSFNDFWLFLWLFSSTAHTYYGDSTPSLLISELRLLTAEIWASFENEKYIKLK